MRVLLNPGSGPVTGDAELAYVAIGRFVADVCNVDLRTDGRDAVVATPVGITSEGIQDDGRYRFVLSRDDRSTIVDIPGLPIERVRYWGVEQNPFDFPRLFVDGSSWLWEFAVSQARRALAPKETP
jgi:hypothetical protein